MLASDRAGAPIGLRYGDPEYALPEPRGHELRYPVSWGLGFTDMSDRLSRLPRGGSSKGFLPHACPFTFGEIVTFVHLGSSWPILGRSDPAVSRKERRLYHQNAPDLSSIDSLKSNAISDAGDSFAHLRQRSAAIGNAECVPR